MADVAALAQYFANERDVVVPADAHARTVLAALLTQRPPSPLPASIQHDLDQLLHEESVARPTTSADSLPSLAQQGFPSSLFTERTRLWQGDLTLLRADAIVNAANDRTLGCFVPGHACIDNVIHAVAGPGLRAECAEHMSRQGHPEPTGTATVTAGYHLPSRYVIHTVGPIVPSHQPTADDAAALASCYRAILDRADAVADVRTVGFCAISTGVFGYPKDTGARVAVATVRAWLDEHPHSSIEPLFAAFTAADEEHYRNAVSLEVSDEP